MSFTVDAVDFILGFIVICCAFGALVTHLINKGTTHDKNHP